MPRPSRKNFLSSMLGSGSSKANSAVIAFEHDERPARRVHERGALCPVSRDHALNLGARFFDRDGSVLGKAAHGLFFRIAAHLLIVIGRI